MGTCFSSCFGASPSDTVTRSPLILTIQQGTGRDKVTVTDRNPVHVTGTGDVMVGTNSRGGEAVAVKVLRHSADDQYIEQAKNIRAEATAWRDLDHPNILPFIDTAEDDNGRLYLLSPWMENGSLNVYLQKHVDANRPRFLLQTATALVYLHGKGIIHGDIKGSNILVSSGEEPCAMLCDFGLSRRVVDPTLPGLKGGGTVRWQAPELWDNKPKSYQSDSYSFGMTISEILSGNEPFHDCNNHGVLLARINAGVRPPKEPETCPRSNESWGYLWAVAERCWSQDIGDRPSMRTVHRLLQDKRVDNEEEPSPAGGSTNAPGSRQGDLPNGTVSQPEPKIVDGEPHKETTGFGAGTSGLTTSGVA